MAVLKIKRICARPGCFNTSYDKYCDEHPEPKRDYKNRPSAYRRGYDHRWQKARAFFLRQNPLCVGCLKAGRNRPALIVDHIVPHKGDMVKFWDQNNWQSLCVTCHATKSAKEDGGFGNPLKRK